MEYISAMKSYELKAFQIEYNMLFKFMLFKKI